MLALRCLPFGLADYGGGSISQMDWAQHALQLDVTWCTYTVTQRRVLDASRLCGSSSGQDSVLTVSFVAQGPEQQVLRARPPPARALRPVCWRHRDAHETARALPSAGPP